jgi:hypothetical protein
MLRGFGKSLLLLPLLVATAISTELRARWA